MDLVGLATFLLRCLRRWRVAVVDLWSWSPLHRECNPKLPSLWLFLPPRPPFRTPRVLFRPSFHGLSQTPTQQTPAMGAKSRRPTPSLGPQPSRRAPPWLFIPTPVPPVSFCLCSLPHNTPVHIFHISSTFLPPPPSAHPCSQPLPRWWLPSPSKLFTPDNRHHGAAYCRCAPHGADRP